MGELIDLEDGTLMSEAGAHFPRVCEEGKPLACPGAVAT